VARRSPTTKHSYWGRFTGIAPDLLPNIAGATVQSIELETGDIGYVTVVQPGLYVCRASTLGAAIWEPLGGGGGGGGVSSDLDDFLPVAASADWNWTIATSGGGVALIDDPAAAAEVSPAHPGVIRIGTGVGAISRASIRQYQLGQNKPVGVGSMFVELLVRVPLVATAADDYNLALGWSNNPAIPVGADGAGTAAIGFRYNFGLAVWNAYARVPGETLVPTGVAPGVVWQRLRIDVDAVDARFYIGPSPGPVALVATIPTPSLPLASIGVWSGIQKIVTLPPSVVGRDFFLDYCWRGFDLAGVR
jgi:hypothetical protein